MKHLNLFILLFTYLIGIPLSFIFSSLMNGIPEAWDSTISMKDEFKRVWTFYKESDLSLISNNDYWEFRESIRDREDILDYSDDIFQLNRHISFFSEGNQLFIPWAIKIPSKKHYFVDKYADVR